VQAGVSQPRVTLLYLLLQGMTAILALSYESASNGQRFGCPAGGLHLLQVLPLAVFGSNGEQRGKSPRPRGPGSSPNSGEVCAALHRAPRRRAAKAALDCDLRVGLLATRPPRSRFRCSWVGGGKEPSLAPGGFLRRYGRLGEPP